MDPAFSYRDLKLVTKEDRGPESSEVAEVNLRQVDHFAAEMDSFATAILEDSVVRTPASMGISDLRIIAALEESIEKGLPVKVST